MENLFVGALIFVVGLFSHSFLPSYMKKKGENLATKGDIQDLAAQTALLTQTAKEIETKITDKVWDRQKRWELKRDQILLVSENAAAVKNSIVSLHGICQTELKAKAQGQPERTGRLTEVANAWNLAADDLERTALTISLVCGAELFNALSSFIILTRDVAMKIVAGDGEAFSKQSDQNAPRTVTVSESQAPPVVRAGLLQSTLIVLPVEEKVANVFAGDTVDWVFDGGHVASRFVSVKPKVANGSTDLRCMPGRSDAASIQSNLATLLGANEPIASTMPKTAGVYGSRLKVTVKKW